MRKPSLFKQRDVTRAAKAARAAGLGIAKIEISREGSIIVVPGAPATEGENISELDSWRENRDAG